jgi:predicted ester cyclase
MSNSTSNEIAKAIVRRNTEEVQGKGNFDVFEELFADDFVDHTPQPNMTPDKPGARGLYKTIREAFPDFHAIIHWQTVDGEIVTTFKTYHGTHQGIFLGVAPTGRKIHFETLDAMRVHNCPSSKFLRQRAEQLREVLARLFNDVTRLAVDAASDVV